MQKLAAAEGVTVKVGVLAGKGGSRKHTDSNFSLIEIAAVHEFGAPKANIPERSFIRRTFLMKRGETNKHLERLVNAIVKKDLPIATAFGALGTWAAAEVKKTMTVGPHIPPPLKPRTVAAKGSSRPLIDTGQLANSINWEIGR